jgi:hypothetical protein
MIAASLFRGLAGPTGAATVRKDSSAATTPANVQTMQNRNSMFKCSCVAVRQETRLVSFACDMIVATALKYKMLGSIASDSTAGRAGAGMKTKTAVVLAAPRRDPLLLAQT